VIKRGYHTVTEPVSAWKSLELDNPVSILVGLGVLEALFLAGGAVGEYKQGVNGAVWLRGRISASFGWFCWPPYFGFRFGNMSRF